jgi:orotate phosphoribosyltransferase-like protein
MQTALIWGPAIFLAFFAIFDVWQRSQSRQSDIPWSIFNIGKLLGALALIALSIVDLVMMFDAKSNDLVIYDVQIATAGVKIGTFVRKNFHVQKIIF